MQKCGAVRFVDFAFDLVIGSWSCNFLLPGRWASVNPTQVRTNHGPESPAYCELNATFDLIALQVLISCLTCESHTSDQTCGYYQHLGTLALY